MKGSLAFPLIIVLVLSACQNAEPTAIVTITPIPSSTLTLSAREPEPSITPEPAETILPTPTPTVIAATPTPVPIDPTATPLSPYQTGAVWIYPGPTHYEGDILSFEIPVHNLFAFHDTEATVTVDSGTPMELVAFQRTNSLRYLAVLILKDFFDTAGKAGRHELRVQATMNDIIPVDITFTFEVLPASERPAQEESAEWLAKTTECCEIRYLSGTAADRDIEPIAQKAQESYERVVELFGEAEDQPNFRIILLDNLWGNGGVSIEEGVIISYPDRNYSPNRLENLEAALRHEMTHFLAVNSFRNDQLPGFLGEGLAVYAAGGHYKEEPMPERMAALAELGYYHTVVDLSENFGNINHEIRYLESAGVIVYIVETYGWEDFVRFGETRVAGENAYYPPEWLNEAIPEAFGISLEEFESNFLEWAQNHEPGDQLEDLQLTIKLQEARRDYQIAKAPFFNLGVYTPILDPERISISMREPDAPENVAIEALIINAQQAILEGQYEEAEKLVLALRRVVYGGDRSGDLISDYQGIAEKLADEPFQVEDINLDGGLAEVEVSDMQAELRTIRLKMVGEEWEIEPDS